MANILYLPDSLDFSNREVFKSDEGQTFSQWLESSGFDKKITEQAVYIKKNGEDFLQADFGGDLDASDLIVLIVIPQWAAVIKVVAWVVANWQLIAAVVAIAMMAPGGGEPDLPNDAAQADASPTYNVSSRGNRARLGQPKPVLYGKMRTYPDLASRPFTEFENGEDQVLYQLFEITQGDAVVDVGSIRFEDTPLNRFEDYDVEVLGPGQRPTLYPASVDTSSELSNLEIDGTVGPYVANQPTTRISRLSVDVVAARGIFRQDSESGAFLYSSVGYRFEARELSDADAPLGGWFTLGSHTISGDSRDSVRQTHSYRVDSGRYEVRVLRTTPKAGDIYVQDEVSWYQLKGYLEGSDVAPETTRIAIKIRSSEQLGNRAVSKFNLISSRKLPTWSPVNGWGPAIETNNLVWAFADACRASYGGSRADHHVDLKRLYELRTLSMEFNGVFDTKGDLWQALTKIAQAGRCMPVDRAGVYTLVADRFSDAPVQMFSMRNIVRDTFRINHVGVLAETSDAVLIEYYDREQDYRQSEMLCALSGSPGANPRRVRMFGCTSKEEALKSGMYLAAQNQYRRQLVTFETGMEGHIPFYGDLITVSHFMLGVQGDEQVSGEVRAFNGVDTFELTESVERFANPYIVFRGIGGEPSSAYRVQHLSGKSVRVLDSFDAGQIVVDEPGYDSRTHFAAGDGNSFCENIKVTKVVPVGRGRVRISGFVDDLTVYTAADGLAVPPINTIPGASEVAPVVSGLVANMTGTVELPVVYLSWQGQNADRYLVELSVDGGNSWSRAGQGVTKSTRFTHRPVPGVIQYRVAAENIFRGAWQYVTIDTDKVLQAAPPVPYDLALRESFVGRVLKLQWKSATVAHYLQFVRSGSVKYSVLSDGLTFDLGAAVAQQYGLGRDFEVRVFAVSLEGVKSLQAATLDAYNPPPAMLDNLIMAGVIGKALVTFDWPVDTDLAGVSIWVSDVDGFAPGLSTLAVDKSKDPVLGVPLNGDGPFYARAAAVDDWGDDVNFSGQYSVGGGKITETDITENSIKSPHIAANQIVASHVLIDKLAAISADLGTVVAGLFKTTSGTGGRVEIDSAGNLPFWIGEGAKSESNAFVSFNKATKVFTVRDPSSNTRLDISPGGNMPLAVWHGTTNLFYVDKANDRIVVNNIFARGDITASSLKVGVAMIDQAHIKNAVVDTLQLAGQAVTVPVSASTSGASYIYGYTTVQSLSMNPQGAPVALNFSMAGRASGSSAALSVKIRVLRGGTVVWENTDIACDSDRYSLLSAGFTDYYSGNTRTYYLQIAIHVGDHVYTKNRNLSALGVKR